MPKLRKPAYICVALLTTLVLTSCAGGDDSTEESTAGSGDESAEVQDVVRRSIEAENAKDSAAFAALWTDKGLEEYDVGTREELESGVPEWFGQETLNVVEFVQIDAEGGEGSATLDVVGEQKTIAKPVFRVRYDAVESDGQWLMDGFEFLGSPPPADGTPVVNIEAVEYAFNLDKTEAPGDLAFRFANTGEEPHEISFFKGPDGTDVATAQSDLEDVDGEELEDIPTGYQVDHIAFAMPGDEVDLTFAEPLAPGDYFLVCYLPAGGLGDEGESVDPDAEPHVKLGMISKLTVQ